jgi:hypothetical protein
MRLARRILLGSLFMTLGSLSAPGAYSQSSKSEGNSAEKEGFAKLLSTGKSKSPEKPAPPPALTPAQILDNLTDQQELKQLEFGQQVLENEIARLARSKNGGREVAAEIRQLTHFLALIDIEIIKVLHDISRDHHDRPPGTGHK